MAVLRRRRCAPQMGARGCARPRPTSQPLTLPAHADPAGSRCPQCCPSDAGGGYRNRVASAEESAAAGQLRGITRLRSSLVAAFIAGAAVGLLGGMIGLGGAEFRLPLLIGLFGFLALQAVIMNKAMCPRTSSRVGVSTA
jgi:hypothetical protein